MGYFYLTLTLALTIYGQLVLKWQVSLNSALLSGEVAMVPLLLRMLCSPWVISALAAAFAASLSWMAALHYLDLSKAYPLTAANFVLVSLLAAMIFGEQVGALRMAGLLFISVGLVLVARS